MGTDLLNSFQIGLEVRQAFVCPVRSERFSFGSSIRHSDISELCRSLFSVCQAEPPSLAPTPSLSTPINTPKPFSRMSIVTSPSARTRTSSNATLTDAAETKREEEEKVNEKKDLQDESDSPRNTSDLEEGLEVVADDPYTRWSREFAPSTTFQRTREEKGTEGEKSSKLARSSLPSVSLSLL